VPLSHSHGCTGGAGDAVEALLTLDRLLPSRLAMFPLFLRWAPAERSPSRPRLALQGSNALAIGLQCCGKRNSDVRMSTLADGLLPLRRGPAVKGGTFAAFSALFSG
jgi:hypothetical protein